MGLKVTAKEEPKELPEIGVYGSTIVGVIDRGTQKPKNPKHKASRRLNVVVELVGTEMQEGEYAGEPFVLRRNFSASLGKKSHLRKFVETLTGRKIETDDEFDFEDLLGMSGNAVVVHTEGTGDNDGETYANLETMTPLKKKDGKVEKLDKPKTPKHFFFLPFDADGAYIKGEEFDQEGFDDLPDWEQDIIKQSDEYKQLKDDGIVESKKAKGGKSKAKDEDEEDKPRKGSKSKRDEEEVEEETTTFKRRGR